MQLLLCKSYHTHVCLCSMKLHYVEEALMLLKVDTGQETILHLSDNRKIMNIYCCIQVMIVFTRILTLFLRGY